MVELTSYSVLEEFCDSEGETWYYFIEDHGNEEFLNLLETKLCDVAEDFDLQPSEDYHKETLQRMPTICGYGDSHTVFSCKFSVEKLQQIEDIAEELYKGGISNLTAD